MTALPAGERELFRERYWVPRKPAVILLVYCQVVAWGLVLLGHANTGSNILVVVVAAVIPIGIGVWVELGSRQVWFVVGARTLKLGRAPAFPAAAVRDFELLAGKQSIDRMRLKIRGRSTMWNMRIRPNPNLKGSLAPNGVENAVLIHVDPTKAHMQTNTFLIGTRRPQELMAALHEATGLHGTDTGRSVIAPPPLAERRRP